MFRTYMIEMTEEEVGQFVVQGQKGISGWLGMVGQIFYHRP